MKPVAEQRRGRLPLLPSVTDHQVAGVIAPLSKRTVRRLIVIPHALVHPIVRHVLRAAMHYLEADTWHPLSYHEGHEEHEGSEHQPLHSVLLKGDIVATQFMCQFVGRLE